MHKQSVSQREGMSRVIQQGGAHRFKSYCLSDAKAEGDLVRRDAVLRRAARLARAYPEDVAVREQLDRLS